jgi:hypothetical protein
MMLNLTNSMICSRCLLLTVCIVFSPKMLSPVIQFLFIDFIPFVYEQETYVVYVPILIIILHALSTKIIEYN